MGRQTGSSMAGAQRTDQVEVTSESNFLHTLEAGKVLSPVTNGQSTVHTTRLSLLPVSLGPMYRISYEGGGSKNLGKQVNGRALPVVWPWLTSMTQ